MGGKTEEECKQNVIEVMKGLSAHNVKINPMKCIYLKKQIEYELLEKGKKYVWSEECQRTFEDSKTFITPDSCLQLYNNNAETLIWCDA